jgi:hypothetical protein
VLGSAPTSSAVYVGGFAAFAQAGTVGSVSVTVVSEPSTTTESPSCLIYLYQ